MFGLWQRKIGLSYGWGGGARLEKRLGAQTLRRLALSTSAISAREALEVGLVDQLVSDSSLESYARSLAARLIALPKEPVQTLKSFDSQRESGDFNSLWWNDSHRAILESRKK
jgi:enoyl-CoA hydratase/carnithine racemase